MKIEVVSVRISESRTEIDFQCDCGAGTGEWTGRAPGVGEERYVEFDADEPIQLGANVTPAASPQASISVSGGVVEVTGRLASLHMNEGTASLSFGDGRIELEVAESSLSDLQPGSWYTVRLTGLAVFDTNL